MCVCVRVYVRVSMCACVCEHVCVCCHRLHSMPALLSFSQHSCSPQAARILVFLHVLAKDICRYVPNDYT